MTDIAVNNDGSLVATGSADGVVCVRSLCRPIGSRVNVQSPSSPSSLASLKLKPMSVYTGHSGGVTALCFVDDKVRYDDT